MSPLSRAYGITAALAALALTLAAPVEAQILHIYEYEDSVVGGPVTVTGIGFEEFRIHLPPGVEGLMMTPILKSCVSEGGAPIADDAYVHMHVVRRHPDKYFTAVKIADLMPGRTQTYCPRLSYVPWRRLIPHDLADGD